MLKSVFVLCCGVSLAMAADDPWTKVKAIKSGTELRVYKKGATQPLVVKMDEATNERLVIVNKNEQTSIAKEDIDRVDARPSNKRTVTKETKTTMSDTNADPRSAIPGPTPNRPGTTSSSSTGYSIGGKPDFETVYKRPAPGAKK
jgi:hypothetical protein